MASSIERRIRGLEAVYNDEPCPACGWDGDWSKIEFVVDWDDMDRDDGGQDDPVGPRWCETCGHQLEYVVTWADLDGRE